MRVIFLISLWERGIKKKGKRELVIPVVNYRDKITYKSHLKTFFKKK